MENYRLPVPLPASNWRNREGIGDQLLRGRLITQTFILGRRLFDEDPKFGADMNVLTTKLTENDGMNLPRSPH